MPSRTLFLVLLVLAGALASPESAAARQAPPGASVELDGGLRATSFRGDASFMGGGSVLLHTPAGFSVGGGGWLLLGARTLDPDAPGGGLRLRVSYGGVVVGATVAHPRGVSVEGRLLVGGGNARIEVPIELSRVAVDNFFVLEPELGAVIPLDGPWAARITAAYRKAVAVEDVYGVTAGQLSGGSLGATLSFRGF